MGQHPQALAFLQIPNPYSRICLDDEEISTWCDGKTNNPTIATGNKVILDKVVATYFCRMSS